MKAIETKYKGYRFRSRLEARWAVFFDALGIKWEYEKEGYKFDSGEYYLPDFWLPYSESWKDRYRIGDSCHIEIKGAKPSEHERALCCRLAMESKLDCLLIVGDPLDHEVINYCPEGFGFRAGEFERAPIIARFLSKWSVAGAIHAAETARSARFEHGERG